MNSSVSARNSCAATIGPGVLLPIHHVNDSIFGDEVGAFGNQRSVESDFLEDMVRRVVSICDHERLAPGGNGAHLGEGCGRDAVAADKMNVCRRLDLRLFEIDRNDGGGIAAKFQE